MTVLNVFCVQATALVEFLFSRKRKFEQSPFLSQESFFVSASCPDFPAVRAGTSCSACSETNIFSDRSWESIFNPSSDCSSLLLDVAVDPDVGISFLDLCIHSQSVRIGHHDADSLPFIIFSRDDVDDSSHPSIAPSIPSSYLHQCNSSNRSDSRLHRPNQHRRTASASSLAFYSLCGPAGQSNSDNRCFGMHNTAITDDEIMLSQLLQSLVLSSFGS